MPSLILLAKQDKTEEERQLKLCQLKYSRMNETITGPFFILSIVLLHPPHILTIACDLKYALTLFRPVNQSQILHALYGGPVAYEIGSKGRSVFINNILWGKEDKQSCVKDWLCVIVWTCCLLITIILDITSIYIILVFSFYILSCFAIMSMMTSKESLFHLKTVWQVSPCHIVIKMRSEHAYKLIAPDFTDS